MSYIPEHRIKDRIWLRKGILREVILDIGTKVTFKSYEQGREKAQGAGKVLVWFDEEPPKDIYEECFVRQEAGTTLNIILTMTPIKGMTWVYDDIYLNTSNPDI
jgi:phage terminase large subunit-like protein